MKPGSCLPVSGNLLLYRLFQCRRLVYRVFLRHTQRPDGLGLLHIPALCACGGRYIGLSSRKPVKLRVFSVMLLPLLLGALLQLLLAKAEPDASVGAVKYMNSLFMSGKAMQSGGAVAGTFGIASSPPFRPMACSHTGIRISAVSRHRVSHDDRQNHRKALKTGSTSGIHRAGAGAVPETAAPALRSRS